MALWIRKHKLMIGLILFYFIFRLINLTKLPIFNDEAIYLDWGWREIHRPGFLYYSLYDAKQPFLMWIFGISESIFTDPLFAGRLVSVIAGFLTLVGIYKLSKEFFSVKVGLIAIFLYSIIPLFSFYDRQALMESLIATIGIWGCYFLLKSLLKPSSKIFPILLGITLGIGFFTKSTALLFLISGLIVATIYIIITKKFSLLNMLVVTIAAFLVTILFLLINPEFWSTLPTNSRYVLTLNEILAFPFKIWINSLVGNLQISLVFITPLILITSLIGTIYVFIKKQTNQIIFISFFMVAVLGATILVKIPSDRYLVSFLPFIVIPAAYVLIIFFNKQKVLGGLFILLTILIPFGLTSLQILNPTLYLIKTIPYSPSVNATYLQGITSGFGINEAVNYFETAANGKPIIVGVAENTGNPESALITYFNKSPNIQVVYFAPELFPIKLDNYVCLSFDQPLYFAARDEQTSSLGKFLTKVKTIRSPYGKNTIGIYKLKQNCRGKTLNLHANAT